MADTTPKNASDICSRPKVAANMLNPREMQLCSESGLMSEGYIPELPVGNYFVASQPASSLQCDNMEYQSGFAMRNGHLDGYQSIIGTHGIDSNLDVALMDGDDGFNTDLLNSALPDNQISAPSRSVLGHNLLNVISTTSAPSWNPFTSSHQIPQTYQHQTCTTGQEFLHHNQAFFPETGSQPNISAGRQAYRQQASGPNYQVGPAAVDHRPIANYYNLNFEGLGNNVLRRILVDQDKDPRRVSARKPDATFVEQNVAARGRSARSLATIENGLQAAYRCGILDAHNRIVSNILRELDMKRTLAGLNVDLCDGKVTDKTAKDIRNLLAVYCGHSAKNMSSHLRLKELLQSMQNDLFGAKNTSTTKTQKASKVNANEEDAPSCQISHDVHGTRFDGRFPASWTRSSHCGRAKSKDFKVNEKHTVYHYKGAESISYNCSDGIRRILTESQLAEAQQRTMQNNMGASSATSTDALTVSTAKPAQRPVTAESHEVNLRAGSKRKSEPVSGRGTGSKKTRTRRTTKSDSVDRAAEVLQVLQIQPWQLQRASAPTVESTSQAALIHNDDKLSQYIRGLTNTTKKTHLGVVVENSGVHDILHSGESPESHESNSQDAKQTAEKPAFLGDDDQAELAKCKVGGHSNGTRQLTEKAAAATNSRGFWESESNAVDAMSQRLKELIRFDNSIPHSLILDFMKPTASSIYTAIREAVQRDDFSDQSGLLYDSNQLATAKDEYDSHCQQTLNLNGAGQPEGHGTIHEAEKRTGTKKKTNKRLSTKKTKDKQEYLGVEQIQQELENKQLADILTQALGGKETDLSSEKGTKENVVNFSAAESIKDEIKECSGSWVEQSDQDSYDRETRVIDFEEQLLQSSWYEEGGI